MNGRHLFALLMVPMWLGACADNPVTPADDDHEHDQFFVTLELSDDHLHTLSDIGFEVTIRDEHGDNVTDFELVQVEYLMTGGSGNWRGFDLERHTDHFTGTRVFGSSGEYQFRVAVQRHGEAETSVIYTAPDPFDMRRAHIEVGHYRVEFESFPGHIHEGEEGAMRFWVLEEGAAVEGMEFDIHCEESGGMTEHHAAVEIEAGVYEATHTFESAGEFHAEFGFMDHHGNMVAGDFHFDVAHGH